MAFSFVEHIADGQSNDFAVPFPYIEQSHVRVAVNGVNATFTWNSPGSISLDVLPAADALVKVYRETPKSDRLVNFEDDSIIDEALLDAMALQLFYIAQEAFDLSATSIVVVADGNYDARERRVKNVADPVELTDAVNLRTFQSDFLPRLQAEADRAEAAAATSITLKSDFDLKWAGILQKESDFNAAYSRIQTWEQQVSTNKDAVLVARDAVAAMKTLIEGYKLSIETTRQNFNQEAAQASTAFQADVAAAQTGLDAAVTSSASSAQAAEAAKVSAQAAANAAAGHSQLASQKAQEATSAAATAVTAKDAVMAVAVDAVALQNAVQAAEAAADRAEAAEAGSVTWSLVADKPTEFPPATHSHTWDSVTGKPTEFPPATHSHDWTTIGNKPTEFTPVAHGHAWNEISGKPTFFSGNYADLAGTPAEFPPAAHSHGWESVTGKPTVFPSDWTQVANKPGTFPPAAHGHQISDITGLATAINAASGLAVGTETADPNTATSQVMVTNHANAPIPGQGIYWHITTTFYSAISASANRGQIAVQYNGGNRVYARSCFGGTWTAWSRLDGPNITTATTDPSGGVDGDIWFKV